MVKRQKIAINGPFCQQQATGLGLVSSNLISQLLNQAKDFDLILYSNNSHFKQAYPQQTRSITNFLSPERGLFGNSTRLLWYQTQLNWQLKQQNIDLFYSPVAEGILFPNVPQIVTVHDLIPLQYPECNPKWKYYYDYILPIILKNSQVVICASEYTKQDVIKYYQLPEDKLHVVYAGFNPNLFKPDFNRHILTKYSLKKYLLYVGDMRFYKNIERCLVAFERLNLPDYQLVITGRKDSFFYPKIYQQIQKLAAKDRILFLDYVPVKDLACLYSMAEALIFASLYEGFGLPVLEAMACGCPVITSQVTSIPEVGGNSVYYVNPYDVDSITQGISRILTDRNLRADLSRKGLARAKLFSWSKMAEEVLAIFAEQLSYVY